MVSATAKTTADVAYALAKLVETHGSRAVLEALRDACHMAADFTADLSSEHHEASECWKKAGDSIGFAIDDVQKTESAAVTDLAGALCVLADTAGDE